MVGIQVVCTRYLSDEPQPGIVECRLIDAHGRLWIFIEKTAVVVIGDDLYDPAAYPQPGVIAGEIVNRHTEASGRDIVTFDTSNPCYTQSIQGTTRFEVLPESLIEWEQ